MWIWINSVQDQIRRLTREDLPRLREFWTRQWGAEIIIAHGEVIQYGQVEGLIHADWDGLITFMVRDKECEITSLDSIRKGKGIGTALVNKVIEEAKEQKCERIFLVTTNDNLNALGFYQRRGFELAALHRGAVNESRKLKPSISLIGENKIPLRDEIELEMNL